MGIGHAWMCHLSDKYLYFMLGRSIQCNWTYLKLSLNVSDIFNYWPLSVFKFIFEWLNWPKAISYSLGQPSIRLNLICKNGPPRRFNCLWRFWIALGKLELLISPLNCLESSWIETGCFWIDIKTFRIVYKTHWHCLARALMSFVFMQNISYDLKLAVNVPDIVYDELKISQRLLNDSPLRLKCAWIPLNWN